MNILLTGSTGFIGSNLLPVLIEHIDLNNDDKLIILSNQPKTNKHLVYINHKNYQFTSADFYSQGIERIDIVLHLGAFTPKNSATSNDIHGSMANIINTMHLCKNLPSIPRKFVFCSTLDVYISDNQIITESTPTIPSSLYGQSKLFCEKMLEQWSKDNQVILQTLRIGHIYGPGEDAYQKVIPSFIKTVLGGNAPCLVSDGSERRSFLNVKDCCSMIINAMELNHYPGPINVVSSHSISMLELAQLIGDIAKTGFSPIVQNQQIMTRDFIFDNTKMVKYLGKESIDLRDGLNEELEYFRSKLNL